MATVVYTLIEPGLDRMHVALAGHFPAVIACPGQPAELADVRRGLMTGHCHRYAMPSQHRADPAGAYPVSLLIWLLPPLSRVPSWAVGSTCLGCCLDLAVQPLPLALRPGVDAAARRPALRTRHA